MEPIVLTARALSGNTGVSQAALDLLLALSRASSQLRVRAWVPRSLPTTVDGLDLGRCDWLPISPLTAAGAVLSGEAPPRSVFEQTRLALTGRSRRTNAALQVVNGVGAHGLYAADGGRSSVSALVVHESPRHFDRAGVMSLQSAIHAIASHDYRVFVSERGRAEWNALAALDRSRSLWIPNCAREAPIAALLASDRDALRERFGYPRDALQLVAVGSVIERKGQDIALDALAQLGEHVRLDVLGPVHGVWATELRARVRNSSLSRRVRFLGSVDDVYARMFAADALVLASRAEALPLSVLEAMALGVCIVAADVDGVPELIEAERSGLLFAREDATALAACLQRIDDLPLRAALGAAARARYLSTFSRAQHLAHWRDAVGQMRAR
ncbi:MAG TPA: glycosyltransferase [Polyangiales bacterium]|nr:glycosyltransferase [Polyangiales bacterium]